MGHSLAQAPGQAGGKGTGWNAGRGGESGAGTPKCRSKDLTEVLKGLRVVGSARLHSQFKLREPCLSHLLNGNSYSKGLFLKNPYPPYLSKFSTGGALPSGGTFGNVQTFGCCHQGCLPASGRQRPRTLLNHSSPPHRIIGPQGAVVPMLRRPAVNRWMAYPSFRSLYVRFPSVQQHLSEL